MGRGVPASRLARRPVAGRDADRARLHRRRPDRHLGADGTPDAAYLRRQIGWGEAFPHRVWRAVRSLVETLIAPVCIGADPTDISALMGRLMRHTYGVRSDGARRSRIASGAPSGRWSRR